MPASWGHQIKGPSGSSVRIVPAIGEAGESSTPAQTWSPVRGVRGIHRAAHV